MEGGRGTNTVSRRTWDKRVSLFHSLQVSTSSSHVDTRVWRCTTQQATARVGRRRVQARHQRRGHDHLWRRAYLLGPRNCAPADPHLRQAARRGQGERRSWQARVLGRHWWRTQVGQGRVESSRGAHAPGECRALLADWQTVERSVSPPPWPLVGANPGARLAARPATQLTDLPLFDQTALMRCTLEGTYSPPGRGAHADPPLLS